MDSSFPLSRGGYWKVASMKVEIDVAHMKFHIEIPCVLEKLSAHTIFAKER